MFGFHVAKESLIRSAKFKTMLEAVEDAKKDLDVTAIQIFTHGPRDMKKNKIDYELVKQFCDDNKVEIHIHGAYSTGILKGKPENWTNFQSNLNYLLDAYNAATQIGAKSIVFHLPKLKAQEIADAMNFIDKTIFDKILINKITDKEPSIKLSNLPVFLLEIRAMKPESDVTFESADGLSKLCDAVKSKKITIPWGVCIDTSHQWAGGIDMKSDWNSWYSSLSEFTKSKIQMFHLNGNNIKNFGTGKDVHEIVMSPDDDIWKHLISDETHAFLKRDRINIIRKRKNIYTLLSETDIKNIKHSTLYSIIELAKTKNIPIICEIKRGDYIYTRLLMDVLRHFMK